MPGPNSVPSGDTRLMLGHFNTVILCAKHGDKELDECEDRIYWASFPQGRKTDCRMVPLRHYLAARGRLRTGKTK